MARESELERWARSSRFASQSWQGGVGSARMTTTGKRGVGRMALRSAEGADLRRPLHHHVHHVDPGALGYQPVLDHPSPTSRVPGTTIESCSEPFLELLLIIANIGTAVVIFPIVKRLSEGLALGFVTARLFESTFILVGIVAMLGMITLRHQVAGGPEGSIAYTLAAIKDWTFLLGPGWVVGWGNGLILGYLMYRTGLVPRRLAGSASSAGRSSSSREPPSLFGVNHPSGPLTGCKRRDHPRVPVGTVPRSLLHRERLQTVGSDPPSRRSRGAYADARERTRLAARRTTGCSSRLGQRSLARDTPCVRLHPRVSRALRGGRRRPSRPWP